VPSSSARRTSSLSRLRRRGSDGGDYGTAASSDNELWGVRGRRMAIDLGKRRQQYGGAAADDDDQLPNIIDELDWRRGRRMAIDMTAMYDDVIVRTGSTSCLVGSCSRSQTQASCAYTPKSQNLDSKSRKNQDSALYSRK